MYVSERWGRSCPRVIGFLATLSALCGEAFFWVKTSRFLKDSDMRGSRSKVLWFAMWNLPHEAWNIGTLRRKRAWHPVIRHKSTVGITTKQNKQSQLLSERHRLLYTCALNFCKRTSSQISVLYALRTTLAVSFDRFPGDKTRAI